MKQAGVEPSSCSFKMIAIGPLFPEQADIPSHNVMRDRVGALEKRLAEHLKQRGYDVVGGHPPS
ncbi:MAG: hypothetical protein NTZ98_22730, partial [Acidobacteria bacterium]|nr:hypothetical protein [Acidobacteriota bacterium]